MYDLTFLKGIKPGYTAAKTFEKQGNVLRKTSDYNIGATFAWQTVTLPFIHRALSDQLMKRGDHGWFHIYGNPIPDLPNRAARRKVNFPPAPTRLLVLDLDKFKLPTSLKWADAVSIIRDVLRHLGLTVLADANFTYVLTSSQLNKEILSCHIYFFLDQPVELRDLRRWAMLVNKGIGEKIIDDAVFRSVQPVYVSPPTCVGFDDPFKGNRIGYYEPNPGQLVPLVELQKLGFVMNKVPTPNAAVMPMQYKTLAANAEAQTEGMKKNWLDSVEAFVGTERGINKPAFRAAAQMVNEEGAETVRDGIEHYVKTFHSEVWKAIQKHGRRGDQSDIDTYDENKIRNYIESALDKEFGNRADQLADLVTAAIDQAITNNSPAPVTSREVLRAAATLMSFHITKWYEVRADFKNRVGKLMPIGAFEKQARLVGTSSTHKDINLDEPAKAVEAVVRKLTLIVDTLDRDYIYYPDPSSPVGYKLIPVADPKFNSSMDGFFFDVIGGAAASQIVGMYRTYLNARIANRKGINLKTGVKVGRRFYSDGKTNYFHAGAVGSHDITVKVTASKVSYEKTINVPDVMWQTSEGYPVEIPTQTQLEAQFGTHDPTFEQCREYILNRIRQFITCDEKSVVPLITLACSLLVRQPQVYHGLFEGGTGTGKTYGATVFKQLFDPTDHDSSIETAKVSNMNSTFQEEDYTRFMINDVTAYDNVINVRPQTQTIMSQLSTGTMKDRRVYYTQMNTKMILSQCVILTSTGNPVTQTDLANRVLVVLFDREFKESDSYPLKEFLQAAPIIRHCWLRIAAALMFTKDAIGKMVTTHIRETNMAIVEAIMNPTIQLTHKTKKELDTALKEIAKIVDDAGRQKKFEDLDVDAMTKIFIAFLDSHTESDFELSAADRWTKFRDWVRLHNGQNAPFQLEKGAFEINVDLMALPDTQRSFDMRMGASMANVTSSSLWECSRKRYPSRLRYVHKIRSLF